jgi:TRAP-type C4-dicarboxylate transport system substrate-binding protein
LKKVFFLSLAAILILSVGVIASGCGGGGGGGTTVWNYTITLRAHYTISNSSSITTYVYNPWMDQVKNLTGTNGGTFDFDVTYGDAPFDDTQSLVAISSGSVDIGQLNPSTYKLGGLGYLPFFFPNISSCAYVSYLIDTEGNQTWDKGGAGELQHVKILMSTPLWPVEYWGWFNVTQLSDISGLRIRAESGEADTITALGASPYDIGTSELATALVTHAVDGCFFTWTGIQGFIGLNYATNYTTEIPNMYFRPYALAMNKDAFDALPAEAQTLLMSVSGATASANYAIAHLSHTGYLKGLTAANRTIDQLTDLSAWETATENVSADWAAYMDGVGWDGTGIVARALALLAAGTP